MKDSEKSSSRKLRRVIYYLLYRMDPQKTHYKTSFSTKMSNIQNFDFFLFRFPPLTPTALRWALFVHPYTHWGIITSALSGLPFHLPPATRPRSLPPAHTLPRPTPHIALNSGAGATASATAGAAAAAAGTAGSGGGSWGRNSCEQHPDSQMTTLP